MSEPPAAGIAAIVVTYHSAAVIDACLASLQRAAPRLGLRVVVVDNASADDGAARAARFPGVRVLRLPENRGYAAGVNAGLVAAGEPWIAVLNPDTVLPEGGLDALAGVLAAHPRAGLVGPRVLGHDGRQEATVGRFPTLQRERAHTWMLDRMLGREGRRAPFPGRTAPVDWVSGCAWLLRAGAVRQVGPLDEGYFMYWEDVDYCRRLTDAGWEVLATPNITLTHALGQGSGRTAAIPADGGPALVRYFERHHPEVDTAEVRRLLAAGWRARRVWRRARALLGDRGSASAAERYRIALESLRNR